MKLFVEPVWIPRVSVCGLLSCISWHVQIIEIRELEWMRDIHSIIPRLHSSIKLFVEPVWIPRVYMYMYVWGFFSCISWQSIEIRQLQWMRNIHSIIFSFKTKSAIKYQAFCRTCLNSEGLSVRFAGGGFGLEEGLTHDWLVLHRLWIGRLYYNLLLNLDLGCLKFRHAYYIHYSCKFDVFYWTFYPVSSHTWLNNWFEEIAGLLRISFKWLDEECITMCPRPKFGKESNDQWHHWLKTESQVYINLFIPGYHPTV